MANTKKNGKKIALSIILILAAILTVLVVGIFIFLYGCTTHERVDNNMDATHTGMYVDGTVLRNSDGTAFVMRGINHAHCWYTDYDETALDAIAATGANCVRIVCANGKQWDSDTVDSIADMIAAAYSRKMVAVLEVHDGTGDDSIQTLSEIVDFWINMAPVLKGTEDYCILNIANEWVGSWNADLWEQGYTKAIPRLREAGIKNVIMVDAAGWGQYGRSIRKNGIEVFESDPDRNTMFSVHMYGMSGCFNWLIRYNLEGVTDQNLCVCVGEFGYTHEDGDVKEDYLMQYCEEKGIGYLAWSFKGNSGGVEYLDLSYDWEGNNLSPQWGEKVVNGEYGIRKTSIISSYFTNE